MRVIQRFPSAMRLLAILEPARDHAPSKFALIPQLLEEALQTYSRCLLLADGFAPTGSVSAVQEAEWHMMWRSKLREAIDAILVDVGQDVADVVSAAVRELDHLMYTLDRVLGLRNVHCVAVASGIHA